MTTVELGADPSLELSIDSFQVAILCLSHNSDSYSTAHLGIRNIAVMDFSDILCVGNRRLRWIRKLTEAAALST